MKKIYFLIFTFFIVFNGFSQFESPKKKFKIGAVKNPISTKTEAVSNSPQIIKYESTIIKNPNDKLLKNFSLLPKKEEVNIMEVESVRQPSEIYTEKFNEKYKEDGLRPELFNRNMSLGNYVVSTQEISIDSRDYGAIDGDLVRVWLNGEIVSNPIYLQSDYKKITLQLKKGLNVLEIEALNYGEFSPNTGQFNFFDAKNELITNQYWGLGIGYRAKINIEYKDNVLKKEEK